MPKTKSLFTETKRNETNIKCGMDKGIQECTGGFKDLSDSNDLKV